MHRRCVQECKLRAKNISDCKQGQGMTELQRDVEAEMLVRWK